MTVSAAASRPQSPLPWNANDKRGLAISILAPLALCLIVNVLIFAFDINQGDANYDAVSFSPPGWLVGAIWLIIYPMWGAARWYARQSGLAGRRRSRWIAALIVWGLLYPFVTANMDTAGSAAANVASLALGLVAAAQARGVSKRAFWLIVPSLFWMSFASILGLAALANA